MEQSRPRGAIGAPVCALALGAAAAVSFGVGEVIGFVTPATEGVFTLAWLLGWILLAWAAIVGAGYAVSLSMRPRMRRPVSGKEIALALASLALVVGVAAAHPMWGTGSGVG